MAKTKSSGAARLGRDSQPKYLGVKLYAGQTAKPGMIIIRQRGKKFMAGKNVRRGGDDTLYSLKEGKVSFKNKKFTRFNGSRRIVKVVNVE